MSDKSLRASKAAAIKTSAEQDLMAALSYVEEAEAPFFDKRRKLTLDDTAQLFSILDKAAKHVAAARAKNDKQTVSLSDGKADPITFTLDEIAAAISHREGHIALVAWSTALNDENKNTSLYRARSAFQKAIKFCPDRQEYYLNLANVFKLMDAKSSAQENIDMALKLSPDDPEAIKLHGEIAEMPEPQVHRENIKEKAQSHPFLYTSLSGVVVFILGAISMNFAGPGKALPEAVTALLCLAGLVLFGLPIYLYIKFASDYRDYERTRIRQDTAQLRNEIYEERYQAERERRVR